jgi:hypothetical protein
VDKFRVYQPSYTMTIHDENKCENKNLWKPLLASTYCLLPPFNSLFEVFKSADLSMSSARFPSKICYTIMTTRNRVWWRVCTMAMRDECLKQKKCIPSLTSVCCCLFPCTSADGWMFVGRSPCDFCRTWKPVHTMFYIRNWRKHLN